ncbi:MAG TPA: hypothetical protein VH442_15025 [Micromonosporaceae bacterium]
MGGQAVGVKCGWFGGERTHAIALVAAQGGTVGAAVTTSALPDEATRAAVRNARGDDVTLIAVHDAIAGNILRSAMHRALVAAADLPT